MIALGVSYSDVMAMPMSERLIMSVVLGKIYGGKFDFEKRVWTEEPHLGVKLF